MAKTSTRIGREVAEASRTMTGKQRRGYPSSLIATARGIERLMARRRKLKKELRHLDADIKHEKRCCAHSPARRKASCEAQADQACRHLVEATRVPLVQGASLDRLVD